MGRKVYKEHVCILMLRCEKMIKKYCINLVCSGILGLTFLMGQGSYAHAQTASSTNSTSVESNTATIASSHDVNKAEFVQNTLPQTGVEANHSGLYFSIAGFFLLLALITSRSKTANRSNEKTKNK